MIRPVLLISVCLLGFLVPAATAEATWTAGGLGTGQGAAATMPAGLQPTTSATAQNVTVAWPQSTFLGAYTGGGYLVRRYAQGGFVATVPAAACATAIGGSALTLQCIEAGVPFGSWQYTVRPVLATFTGDEGPRSATVAVATAAPVLAVPARADPASGQTLGDVGLSWGAVTGATGYNVYRRTSAGSYPATPLNGATPLTATTFTDPASGLAAATSYRYVVRAVAGSPSVESANSNEPLVTPVARPPAPASVTATAAIGARVDVSWAAVPNAVGYNVYRRSTGSFDFAVRLTGATIVGTTLADATAVDGTTYTYVVRSVIAGGGPVESLSSVESAPVTADGTAPAPPATVNVTDPYVLPAARCAFAAGARFVNNAGKAAVNVAATLATAPEAGATVVFSATTPGSTAVSGSAPAAAPTATLNLTSLLDGALTLTALSRDALGNTSTATPLSAANAVRKDVVFTPPLSIVFNPGILGVGATVSGNAECGADVVATKGATVKTATVANGASTYSISVSGLLASAGWTATATDPANNPATPASD